MAAFAPSSTTTISEWPYSSAWRWNISLHSSKAACILMIVFSAALTGCGRDSGRSAAPKPPKLIHDPKLIHGPPITQLAAEQLRSLSMECEKYVPDESARGPYDAAYCEDAIAAWSD